MGICLPNNSSKYKVMIKIGDFEIITSDPKEYKNGYNRWSERFPKQIMKSKNVGIEEMDKIYIYLDKDTKQIKLEGFMCPEYFAIRKLIYAHFGRI